MSTWNDALMRARRLAAAAGCLLVTAAGLAAPVVASPRLPTTSPLANATCART
ncbi:hypothetical protein ACIBEF_09365 [Micromonospora sp. NPDC050795]|uniref:hypothetical protein n=1 Tax=Micromonospora sp. NPDC050795 TaxID=3364282 RepID=UPI00378CB932